MQKKRNKKYLLLITLDINTHSNETVKLYQCFPKLATCVFEKVHKSGIKII